MGGAVEAAGDGAISLFSGDAEGVVRLGLELGEGGVEAGLVGVGASRGGTERRAVGAFVAEVGEYGGLRGLADGEGYLGFFDDLPVFDGPGGEGGLEGGAGVGEEGVVGADGGADGAEVVALEAAGGFGAGVFAGEGGDDFGEGGAVGERALGGVLIRSRTAFLTV